MSETYNVTEIQSEKSNVANTKTVEKQLNSTQLITDEVLLKINYSTNAQQLYPTLSKYFALGTVDLLSLIFI